MTPIELGGLIFLISAIVVGVSFSAYAAFSRFMEKERVKGERFREMHGGAVTRAFGHSEEDELPNDRTTE